MKSLLEIIICVLCALAVMMSCGISEKTVDNKPADIQHLIFLLGSGELELREKAQEELIKIGGGLIQEYRKVLFTTESLRTQSKDKIVDFTVLLREACNSKDLEIRNRANYIRQYFHELTKPKIAFTSNRDGNFEIYVMDLPDGKAGADGSNQARLTENNVYDEKPAWSPDGTKIAFVSERDGNREIYIMPAPLPGGNANGKNPIRLTENQADDFLPAWSPDGTKIAFCSDRTGNEEIYVMPARTDGHSGGDKDGKNQTRLTKSTRENYAPAWSPDGTKICYYSHGEGGGIYLMSADGKNQTRLIDNQADGIRTTWSPDGNKIAFESESGERHHAYAIYVMDLPDGKAGAVGKNQTILTEKPTDGHRPAWSPDGTKIAFQSAREGNYEIYVMPARPSGGPARPDGQSGGDTDGKNQTRLTKDLKGNYSSAWNPLSFSEISALFAEEEKKVSHR